MATVAYSGAAFLRPFFSFANPGAVRRGGERPKKT